MLHELTAIQWAALIRSGQVSATEAMTSCLARIHALNPDLGALTYVADDEAMDAAEAVDRRLVSWRRAGRIDELPPLLGVPIPIKDLNSVAGMPYECGSAALAGRIGTRDDGIATMFRDAGAIIVGKSATPEFGFAVYTEPEGRPAAVTPWDPRRSAGGSSGGAASAVASGMVPLAHASDAGGSIRVPAASCGLVGLKPSRFLVSPAPVRVEGIGLSCTGVVSRTVADTALALDVLCHEWPGDLPHPEGPDGGYRAAVGARIGQLRIGVLRQPIAIGDAPLHPEADAALTRLLRHLDAAGHELVEIEAPLTPADWDVFRPLWSAFAASTPIPRDREASLRPLTRWLRERGRELTAVDLLAAEAQLELLRRQVLGRLAGLDLVVTPELTGPPPFVGSIRDDDDPASDFDAQSRLAPWNSIWNMTGNPAISVPLHTAVVDGTTLPFGVQLVAPWGRDDLLLALAAWLEEIDPWEHPGLGLASD